MLPFRATFIGVIMTLKPRRALLILFTFPLLAFPLLGYQQAHDHSAPPLPPATAKEGGEVVVNVPATDPGADTLEARGKAEQASVGRFKVFHGFRFTDRQPESGITF